MRLGAIGPLVIAAAALGAGRAAVVHAQDGQQATFRSAVDRVAMAVTVRTRQGKPVEGLSADDFVVYDTGEPRKIQEFRVDQSAVSLALLADFSGSMDVADKRQAAKAVAFHLMSWLDPGEDRAGLFAFDQHLKEVQPLGPVSGHLVDLFDTMRPYGKTSLFDAIAETGRAIAETPGTRRAIVALTDGMDNASRLDPAEVSRIASAIDVPVYIVVVVSPLDRVGPKPLNEDQVNALVTGPLANLAHWTGGEIFAAVSPSLTSQAARQIVTELRDQYWIAFAPDQRPGWHPIDVRARDRNLVVRARSGYVVNGRPEGRPGQ
jgi:VWFA-related protein